jgi:23S rRNA (cytosine1962-C5)-methyltransferase
VVDTDSLANRLRKNFRHLCRWANRHGLGAFRIYDSDIPEFPCAIDWYEGFAHVLYYPPRRIRRTGLDEAQDQIIEAIRTGLEIPAERIFVKTHVPMKWGEGQYGRLARTGKEQAVREGGLEFWVNLADYVDSGLFLDHRLTRARIRAEARGKRFLNLFSYTGSFTVYAAAGGAASTTSVDLSRAYLDWAKRNLALNRLDQGKHAFIQADVLEWIEKAPANAYDLIVLDPPSFSASKKMHRAFEVQRDHATLLEGAMALVDAGGALYFSTNFRGFRLDFPVPPGFGVEELTPDSIPEDFRRKDVHRCWCFRRSV